MARSRRNSVRSVISTVLFIAFGLIAIAILYKAVSDSTENRTQAAAGTIAKSWEFTAPGDSEGWSARYTGDLTVSDGFLRVLTIKTSHPGRIRNTSVNTKLARGNKTLTLSMAVSPKSARSAAGGRVEGVKGVTADAAPDAAEPELDAAQLVESLYAKCTPPPSCTDANGTCPLPEKIPVGGFCPPRNTRSFTFLVFYRLAGKDKFERKPLTVRGVVDSRFHEYELRFPEIGVLAIDRLNIQFVRGVIAGDLVQLDWIRLLSPSVPTPIPNITPTCRPRPPCLDTEPRCLLPETEDMCPPQPKPTQAVGQDCRGKSDGTPCTYQDCLSCIQREGVVCPEIPCRLRPGECKNQVCVPSPTPPPGCVYRQVQCIQAPCLPVLICTTPTPPAGGPTPTPKPSPGCYYRQVQCIQAPCPPILVCPTPQ